MNGNYERDYWKRGFTGGGRKRYGATIGGRRRGAAVGQGRRRTCAVAGGRTAGLSKKRKNFGYIPFLLGSPDDKTQILGGN